MANGKNRQELIELLNKASLKGESQNEAAKKLQKYSPDNTLYYRITVVKRALEREIMTFAEAEQQGVLDKLLNKELEAEYVKLRETDPTQYQKADGSWKSFDDVSDLVADVYFSKLRKAIEKDYTKAIAPKKPPTVFFGDFLASIRLSPYMRKAKEEIQKDPKNAQKWVKTNNQSNEPGQLKNRKSLEDQLKLIQTAYQGNRSDIHSSINANEVFAMKVGSWSQVNTPASGDLNFFHLEKREAPNDTAEMQKVNQLYRVIATDAQRIYMQKLLNQLKDKKALSLEYMNQPNE